MDLYAEIKYLVPGQERPVYVASQGGADAALSISAEFEDRRVQMRDARKLAQPPRLDTEGFELAAAPMAGEDFYHLQSFQQAYEAEIIKVVLAASGASDALVFDHTLRSDSPSVRGARQIRETAAVIHNDYSDASAEKRLRDLLTPAEAKIRLGKRYAIINLWRSIGPLVQGNPLALCDATSMSSHDLVASERRAAERIGELELATWSPEHRWFYYPDMNVNESLLIKTFDSAKDGPARRSIHTAFANPQAPADAAPRESMESRLLVFF